ncbi:hypothetical protein [Streptomyces natalensis]|uniref:hypothetical protein n=1 Tax=Streptomyces natalensis TaxID=68242 RepID=UPI00069B9C10|nr:hypothetical protein [Streptomyces natalensis]
MTDLIHRTLTRLQTLFAPRGRHRATSSGHPPRPVRPTPPACNTTHRIRRPGPYAVDIPIDGDATALVRPYLHTLVAEAAR